MDEGAIYRAFGKAVGDRRRSLHKTQEEVARKVGLSRASLANIERGTQRVFLHQIMALTEALELSSAHEIVPERAIAAKRRSKPDVSTSGAPNLSRQQKQMVSAIVTALTAKKG